MADAAELGAEYLEGSGPRRRQPEIGDHAGHHIHLGAEFGDVEIVQDVDRPEQYLDRLADRQMKLPAFDDNVVLPGGVVPIDPEGVFGGDIARFRVPSLPSAPGSRKLHSHCWPITSTSDASCGTVTNWFQTKRPGASIAATPKVVPVASQPSSRLFSGS